LLAGAWLEAPIHFITSASNYMGRAEVLDYIDTLNTDFFKANR